MSSSEEGELNIHREALQARVADLERELRATQSELSDALRKLARCERHYAKANKVNEDLRHHIKELSNKLHGYKHAARRKVDISTQTDSTLLDYAVPIMSTETYEQNSDQQQEDQITESIREQKPEDFDENGMPVWRVGDTEENSQEEGTQSIADSLKAAAQDALNKSGFVYDENSGLYYDHNSGYYYDAERALYYEPGSGTYYYYDHDVQTYKFHSQVDLAQYTGTTDSQYQDHNQQHTHTPGKRKPAKKKEKDKDRKTGGTKADLAKSSERQTRKKKRCKEDQLPKKRHKKGKQETSQRKSCDTSETPLGDLESGGMRGNSKNIDIFAVDQPLKTEPNLQKDTQGATDVGTKVECVERPLEGTANSCDADLVDGTGSRRESHQKIQKVSEVGARDSSTGSESEMEEGEVSDSTEEGSLSSSDEDNEEESVAAHYPPCIRAMVKVSEHLDIGTLFIVTCTGATIGREKGLNLNIIIPDLNISKMHASIVYREDLKKYVIKDHASQNGTSLNGHRLSQAKVMSEEFPLSHGDTLTFGGTQIELHIHPGSETCDTCEPGQVKAALQANQKIQQETVVLSKEAREKQRRQQLRMIKRKFGLENTAYVDNKEALANPAYDDKAGERRRTKGSDNPYQPDDAPASVERAIPESNKGHKMLEKMGWKEGHGLGRTEQGRNDPVRVQLRSRVSAGLGSGASLDRSLDDAASMEKSNKWLRAQERFEKLGKGASPSFTAPPGVKDERPTKGSILWIKGETMDPS